MYPWYEKKCLKSAAILFIKQGAMDLSLDFQKMYYTSLWLKGLKTYEVSKLVIQENAHPDLVVAGLK